MKYRMKKGALYRNDVLLYSIKRKDEGYLCGVYSAEHKLLFRNDIEKGNYILTKKGYVQEYRYVLYDAENYRCSVAIPDYERQDKTNITDCRWNKPCKANLMIEDRNYLMSIEEKGCNYVLKDTRGNILVCISSCGLDGGWNVEAANEIEPSMICGLFIFFKCLERECEFRR